MDEIRKVDLNLATRAELEALPGIGEVLASRIIASRPFKTVDDLAKVEGIRPSVLERLRPYLTVTPIETTANAEASTAIALTAPTDQASPSEVEDVEAEAEVQATEVVPEGKEEALERATVAVAEAAATEVDAQEAKTEAKAAAEAQTETEEIEDQAKTAETTGEAQGEAEDTALSEVDVPISEKRACISRREAWGIALTTGLVAFLLAFLLTLGVLHAINGGLRYADATRYQATAREVQVLQDNLSQAQQSLDTLQRQIADLKSMSDDIQQLSQGQEDLQSQVDEMANAMEQVQASAEKFETFLQGLTDLLNNMVSPVATESATPTTTPTPTPSP